MNAELPIAPETRPRWRRRLSVFGRRSRFMPILEIAVVLTLLAIATASYFIVSDRSPERLLTPPLVAALLVANLVPAMALMVLVARRMARRRAARTPIGGNGRLHVRLVALFSAIAAVPTLLVVIFASLLFQSGIDFWLSDRASGMIRNAVEIARSNYNEELARVDRETVTMSADLRLRLEEAPMDSLYFAENFAYQTLGRNLSEAIVVRLTEAGEVQALALVNPYDRPLERDITREMVTELLDGKESVVRVTDERVGALTRLDPGEDTYLYAARVFDPALAAHLQRSTTILSDYNTLVERTRQMQLRFNAILLIVSLLIVGLAIWVALNLADRLVRPVGQLVDAARKVTAGDLSARVPRSKVHDEVATLGSAFNRMTRRLEEQTGALVSANAQLDSRRAFIEAVLSGVTAGVISVDDGHVIRLTNSSADALLRTGGRSPVGQKLADLAPELDRQLAAGEREEIIQLAAHGEPRTLAVKTVKVAGGQVLTFDDITEQLLDQRRAAWSDVARRIAHEIKNPLTPIQLAAERLQRRYGKEVESDPSTFERLTGTIVRQVGDLRRMVDEFSSFARMPKPVFREEAMIEIARQAVFLHEIAHPAIHFTMAAPDPAPILICDRRLLGQAVTNVVKNGVEAIQQKREESGGEGEDEIRVEIGETEGKVCIEVTDSGIGLPAERGRLTEPYMTTRTKGTGLGLAIVKKIVEEHFGQIEFEDAPGGGTCVRMTFDSEMLARLGGTTRISEEQGASG